MSKNQVERVFLFLLITLVSVSATRISQVRKLKSGKAPTFAAFSPDGRRIFVTNYASDEISVIDTATKQNKTRFYGGHEPVGIAVTPAGDKLLVTNLGNGLVKVIDAHSFRIMDDIKVDGMPSNIAISPKGFLAFVTNYGRGKIGRVDFIDTATHEIIGQVEVGVRPIAILVSPLGDQIYVACGGSNDLYVIDTASRQVVTQLPVGLAPDGLAISPEGDFLYVANSGTDDFSVVDLIELNETRRVKVGSKPFALTVGSDGSIFVVESGDNQLSIFSPSFEKIMSVSVGKNPIDVKLSPDNRFAYVTVERDNRIVVYELTN